MKNIKSQSWSVKVIYPNGVTTFKVQLTMGEAFEFYHFILENDNDAMSVDINQSTIFE